MEALVELLEDRGELQDSRLDTRTVGAILGRLVFAEDQVVAAIAGAFREAEEEVFMDLGYGRSIPFPVDWEATARGVVENPHFRFWIGVLSGHDTDFLQEALSR